MSCAALAWMFVVVILLMCDACLRLCGAVQTSRPRRSFNFAWSEGHVAPLERVDGLAVFKREPYHPKMTLQ